MSTPSSAPVSAAVRRTTVAAVLLVASVAAVASYAHMQHVAHREGEAWRSYLLPLSVDGLMVAASMVLLTRRRAGLPGGTLPWAALLAGVGASLAANVAAAEATTTARIVAAWPAVAFAVAFELLLQQRRPEVTDPAVTDSAVPAPQPPPLAEPAPTGDPAAQPSAAAQQGRRNHIVDNDLLSPTPPRPAHGPGEAAGLAARAAELIDTRDGQAPGRRVLARELGCTEHRARVLLDALSPTGTTPTARGERA